MVAKVALRIGGAVKGGQVAASLEKAAALQRGGTVAQKGQLASKMVAGERVGETVVVTQEGRNVAAAGATVGESAIQQTFKNLGSLEGLGALKADEVLKLNGFVFKGNTPGGYAKYYHPNGAKIQIRPNGQVYRYGGGKGLKYNMDGSISELHGQENI